METLRRLLKLNYPFRTLMSDLQSRPYKPNPEVCCEACVFASGRHATWCTRMQASGPPFLITEELAWVREAMEHYSQSQSYVAAGEGDRTEVRHGLADYRTEVRQILADYERSLADPGPSLWERLARWYPR